MTRKDYVALADALARSRPAMGDGGTCDRYGYEVWYHAFELIADALEADNPRFDRLRFAYAAAAGEDSPGFLETRAGGRPMREYHADGS